MARCLVSREHRRRDRLKIIQEVLKVASREGGARVSDIVYGANLSFSSFGGYLTHLIDRGLLRVKKGRHGRNLYETTEKGRKLLALLRRVKELI